MTSTNDDRGLSIPAVTAGVAVLMVYLLWGVSCAMYEASRPRVPDVAGVAEEDEVHRTIRVSGRGGGIVFAVAGVATFVSKSFTLLPELPGIVAFIFRERFWFVIVSAGVLCAVGLFGLFLKRTEAALRVPAQRRRRRR